MSAAQPGLRFEAAESSGGAETTVLVAPLIDIVFLLICFYLLVAQLISGQKDPAVQLPVMAAMTADEQPAELVINLRRDGAVLVGGRSMTGDELAALLRQQRQEAEQASEPLRVVIRADARQRFAALDDDVLKICKDCGVTDYILRSKPKENSP